MIIYEINHSFQTKPRIIQMKLNDKIYIYILIRCLYKHVTEAMNWAMDSLSWCFALRGLEIIWKKKENKRNSFSIFSQIFVYVLYFIKESKYFILCYYPQKNFTVLEK
jgi:hypothetical protein